MSFLREFCRDVDRLGTAMDRDFPTITALLSFVTLRPLPVLELPF